MSVPNQKIIRISKKKYKENFLQIGIDEWMEAARVLSPGGLKLYLYLASNADGFNLELSPAAIQNELALKRTTYYDSIKSLESAGYLNLIQGNIYQFTTTPVFENPNKEVKQNALSENPNKQNKDMFENPNRMHKETIDKFENPNNASKEITKVFENPNAADVNKNKNNKIEVPEVCGNPKTQFEYSSSGVRIFEKGVRKTNIEIDNIDNIDKINNVRPFDEKRKKELRKEISSGGQILSNGEWILDRFHNFRQEPLSVQIHRLATYGYSAEEAEFIIKEILNDEAMAIVERNLGYVMKP